MSTIIYFQRGHVGFDNLTIATNHQPVW